jgi:hypothetical protein
VLATVGFDVDLRVPLRYVESSDVEHTDETGLLIPWGDSKPTIYEGDANYRVISATFALVADDIGPAQQSLATLRQLSRTKPKPVVCYRDDRGRKLFGATTLREHDRELAWYEIDMAITETNYSEGEAV